MTAESLSPFLARARTQPRGVMVMGIRQSQVKNKKQAARHVAAAEVKRQESVRKVKRDAAVKKRAI